MLQLQRALAASLWTWEPNCVCKLEGSWVLMIGLVVTPLSSLSFKCCGYPSRIAGTILLQPKRIHIVGLGFFRLCITMLKRVYNSKCFIQLILLSFLILPSNLNPISINLLFQCSPMIQLTFQDKCWFMCNFYRGKLFISVKMIRNDNTHNCFFVFCNANEWNTNFGQFWGSCS